MACIRCYVSLLHVLLSVCVVITSSTITATPTPTQPTSRVSRDVTTAGVRGSADYDDASTHYFIIIDAGSSGSRIHVFPYHYANLEGQKWKQRLFRATTAGGEDYVNHSNKNGDLHHHFPVVQESHSKKIVPGLAELPNAQKSGESLGPLLDFAQKHIPMAYWISTPILLKATAGLRGLSFEQSETILEACRVVISHYPFLFQREWATTISGTEEGIYGWVSANYLRDAWYTPVGVLEMGGASLQVTYIPSGNIVDEISDKLIEIRLGPYKFPLYTHSYLGYGLEKVQLMFDTYVRTHMFSSTEKAYNPCYPSGYVFDMGTHAENGNILPPSEGTGSYEQCVKALQNIFDKNKPTCSGSPAACSFSFNGVFQPPMPPHMHFVAIENFYYTSEFFQALPDISSHEIFVDILERKGKDFCANTWKHVQMLYSSESDSVLSKQCFASAFIPLFLKYGVGLTTSDIRNVEVVKKFKGRAIDWALGAVVYELWDPTRAARYGRSTCSSRTTDSPPTLTSSGALLPIDYGVAVIRSHSTGHSWYLFVIIVMGIAVYGYYKKNGFPSRYFLRSWSRQ